MLILLFVSFQLVKEFDVIHTPNQVGDLFFPFNFLPAAEQWLFWLNYPHFFLRDSKASFSLAFYLFCLWAGCCSSALSLLDVDPAFIGMTSICLLIN